VTSLEGSFSLVAVRNLDAPAFDRLAAKTKWEKRDKDFLRRLTGLKLDPSRVKLGGRVVKVLDTIDAQHAIFLAGILADPLFKAQAAYEIGDSARVNLGRLRSVVARMVDDFGVDAVRIWLAFHADTKDDSPRSGEEAEYDVRVGLRCAVLLMSDKFALEGWRGWTVPDLDPEFEALDADPEWTSPQSGHMLPPSRREVASSESEDTTVEAQGMQEISEGSVGAVDASRIDGWSTAAAEADSLREELVAALDASRAAIESGLLPGSEVEVIRVRLADTVGALTEDLLQALRAEGIEPPLASTGLDVRAAIDELKTLLQAREAESAEIRSLLGAQADRLAPIAAALPPIAGFSTPTASWLEASLQRLRGEGRWNDEDEALLTSLERVVEVHAAAVAQDNATILKVGRDRTLSEQAFDAAQEAADLSRWPSITEAPEVRDEDLPVVAESEGVPAPAGAPEPRGDHASASFAPERPPEPELQPQPRTDVLPVDDTETSTELVGEQDVARCLEARAFGLAYWVAYASEWSEERLGVLAAVAHANAMRSSTDAAASGYERAVTEFSLDGLTGNRGLQILAFAAALRTVFVAPYRGAIDVLVELESRIDVDLKDLIAALRRYEGVILHRPSLSDGGAGTDALERRIVDASRSVRDGLQALRARSSKFQRSSDVWREWLKSDGLLGEPLGIVADDDQSRLHIVEECVREFDSQATIRSRLDDTDRALGNSTRNRDRIEGQPVMWVVRNVEEVIGLLRVWAEAVRAHGSDDGAGDGSDTRAHHLRQKLRQTQDQVLDWLEHESERAAAEGGPLKRTAIVAARRLVDETYGFVLEGSPLPTGGDGAIDPLESAVAAAVDVPFSEFKDRTSRGEAKGWLDVKALAAGAEISLEDAFQARCDSDEHAAAGILLDRMSAHQEALGTKDGLVDRLADDLQARTSDARRLLDKLLIECRDQLDRARQEQHFPKHESDAQDFEEALLRLEVEVEDLHEAGDYPVARIRIVQFLDRLAVVLREAQERLLTELNSGIRRNPALAAAADRVRETIERGHLDTARELMILIDEGRALPEDEGDALERLGLLATRVLPAFASKAPRRSVLLKRVTERESSSDAFPIDFSTLSDEAVERASRGLGAWFRLVESAEARTIAAQPEAAVEHLHALLQLVGLAGPFRIERSQRGGDRSALWFSVTNARVAGSVRAHQYGSSAEGRYSVLLLAKVPTAEEIVRRLQDRSGDAPIFVICLGLLSLKERLEFARSARQVQGRPAVVIDLAVCAMLAAGTGRLNDALELALPFSWLDPYDPYANAHVPEEVFVGRVEEMREIESQTGTHFIYGGRQLGKSALLRAAQRSFESKGEARRAVYIDVKSRLSVFDEPILLLRIVAERLREIGVPIPDGRNIDPGAALREGVLAWLAEDDERRLLVLLDEVDGFLRSDAPRFQTVDFFKSLFQDSERRAKPVFAGLQGVQRFMAIENNPFPHLGRHISIGPLDPGSAKALATQPLAVLGLRFEDPNLLARFLGRTNYLPALIQIYCRTLVRYVAKRPIGPGQPPQVITSDDLDRVFNDPDLLEFVRDRFHLTIDLDSRYRIITYAMALNILEGGRSGSMSVDEILDSCNSWWPEGFNRGDWSGFEQLLGEMVGLGVLTRERDGQRYRLRSPNVVNLLGDGDRISQVLLEAGEKKLALDQVGPDLGAFRRIFDGDRTLPLSEQAMRDVIGRDQVRARLRVLLGSKATSADILRDAIRQSIKINDLGNFRTVSSPSDLRRNIKPGARTHFFVDLLSADTERVAAVLGEFRSLVDETPDVEVIALVGPSALPFWDAIHGEASAEGGPAVTLLSRLSGASIQAWGRLIDRPLDDKKSIAAVEAATGGWPVSIDALHRLSQTGIPWEQAVKETRAMWSDPERSAELVEMVGLRRDSVHGFVFDQIAQFGLEGDPLEFRELVEYFSAEETLEGTDVAAVLRDLIALQVLVEAERTKGEARGVLTPEPCFAVAWSTRR
jgi:hypothetical protein